MEINWKLTTPLNIGLTNKNYRYKKYIIRESQLICHPFLEHKNEMLVLKEVTQLNVPVISYFTKNQKFYYVTEFMENTNNLYEIPVNVEIIKLISKIIKKLHNIKVKSKIKTWDWKEQLKKFKNLVKKPLHQINSSEAKVINFLENYTPKNITLCHNDLVPGNFLITNNFENIYLIDYEYAMLNDPLFDLASFISETLWEHKTLITTFLKQFNLTSEDKNIIFWWIQYQNIVWYYWANYFWEITKKTIYYEILEAKWKALNENWKIRLIT